MQGDPDMAGLSIDSRHTNFTRSGELPVQPGDFEIRLVLLLDPGDLILCHLLLRSFNRSILRIFVEIREFQQLPEYPVRPPDPVSHHLLIQVHPGMRHLCYDPDMVCPALYCLREAYRPAGPAASRPLFLDDPRTCRRLCNRSPAVSGCH